MFHSRRALLALTCLGITTGTLGVIASSSSAQQPAPTTKSRSDTSKLTDILRILVGKEEEAGAAGRDRADGPDSVADMPAPVDTGEADAGADAGSSAAADGEDGDPYGELGQEDFRTVSIPYTPPPGQAVRTRCRVEASSCRMREYAESGRRCRCGTVQGRIVN